MPDHVTPMVSSLTKPTSKRQKWYPLHKYAGTVQTLRNRKISLRDISKELNIPRSTASDWTRKEPRQNFVTRTAGHPELEREVIAMIDGRRRQGIAVKDSHIREEAAKIGKRDGITNFKASTGWLRNFKKRHEYTNRKPTHTARKTEFSDADKVSCSCES